MKTTKPDPTPGPAPESYPDPPPYLSERSRALWFQLGPFYADTVARRTLFEQALGALDRAEEAREAITAEGMTLKTASTGAIHVNPLVKVERESRVLFAKLWSELDMIHGRPAEEVLGL